MAASETMESLIERREGKGKLQPLKKATISCLFWTAVLNLAEPGSLFLEPGKCPIWRRKAPADIQTIIGALDSVNNLVTFMWHVRATP